MALNRLDLIVRKASERTAEPLPLRSRRPTGVLLNALWSAADAVGDRVYKNGGDGCPSFTPEER
jgi:hypothetical protein